VPTDEVDVLVIGAGLAGLRCAGVLAAAGLRVQVWEKGDDVGGRIRTDKIDGFLCDRGFQVLNPRAENLNAPLMSRLSGHPPIRRRGD
jgi:phytoene dehydrogenase-like protein